MPIQEFYVTVDIQTSPPVKRPGNVGGIFDNYAPATRDGRPRKRARRSGAAAASRAAVAAAAAAARSAARAEALNPADTDAIPTTMPTVNHRRTRRTRNLITGELELPRPPVGGDFDSDDEEGGEEEEEEEEDGDNGGAEGSPAGNDSVEEAEDDDEEAAAADDDGGGGGGGGDHQQHDGDDNDNDGEAAKLQLLDVGSARPLLALRGKIYACRWATALGTDVFFARRADLEPDEDLEDDGDNDEPVDAAGDDDDGGAAASVGSSARRRAAAGSAGAGAVRAALRGAWAVLGTSAARLIAEPAEIEYRAPPAVRTAADAVGAAAAAAEGGRPGGDRPFLERLVELKQRRGEAIPARLVRMWGPEGKATAPRPSELPSGGFPAPVEEAQSGPGVADSGAHVEQESRGDMAGLSGDRMC